MKYCIYIASLIFLIGCSAGEPSMEKYAPQDFESNEVIKELKTVTKELDSLEMKQYLELKIQDLIELQEVLHNPELDDEIKGYAQEMILKTYPDEKLLEKEYQIKSYTISTFMNGAKKSLNGNSIRGDWGSKKDSWQISLELYKSNTLNMALHPSKTDNGMKFILEVQAY
jgi:hypothetical protein